MITVTGIDWVALAMSSLITISLVGIIRILNMGIKGKDEIIVITAFGMLGVLVGVGRILGLY